MNTKRYLFSLIVAMIMAMSAAEVSAKKLVGDSIAVGSNLPEKTDSMAVESTETSKTDSIVVESSQPEKNTRVFETESDVDDWRVHRYRKYWNALIPTQTIVQFAGNMGFVSVGIGWDYGKHKQWETNLLVGYLPKFNTSRSKMTMTLKQNFIPWSHRLNESWAFEPLTCGIYLNTVFGQEFWNKQPARYPNNYYPFLSTKMRINIFMGQRFALLMPHNRRKFIKSITAFYEFSACDLHIRALFQDKTLKLHDIINLSLGLKLQML